MTKRKGNMNKVLVLAVHPDDETLGCGGTLLKHKSVGDEIYWLIATCMKTKNGFSQKEVLERKRLIEKVKRLYGFNKTLELNIPTTNVDRVFFGELISNISKCFSDIKPNIVYLPFMNDPHSDHRLLFSAAYNCCKTFRYPFIKKVLMMEVLSETEFTPSVKHYVFSPNYFVDIGNFLDKKIEIMKIYRNEIKKHPFPRSLKNIMALATLRGSMANCSYAEGFMILKEIW